MFYNLLNKIKINSIYKKKFFFFKLSKNDLSYVQLLIRLNLIKYIQKINNTSYKYYLIKCNYWQEKIMFKSIYNMYKPSHLRFISLKELKKLTIKKNVIMVISTSKGLLTNIEAVKKNTGGLILLHILL